MLEDDGDRLRFRHELIRDAIYEDLAGSVRRALHREAGQRLAQAGAPALQVAEHLARGARLGDPEAVAWLARAARQAAPRSPDVAADLLDRAAGLMAAGGPRPRPAARRTGQQPHVGRAHRRRRIDLPLAARTATWTHPWRARSGYASGTPCYRLDGHGTAFASWSGHASRPCSPAPNGPRPWRGRASPGCDCWTSTAPQRPPRKHGRQRYRPAITPPRVSPWPRSLWFLNYAGTPLGGAADRRRCRAAG